jgi:hypothetical protein
VDNRNYDRGVLESDRSFNYGQQRDKRGDFVDDRNYNRSALESDRNYNRGVLESNRNYNRGVLESDRNYSRGILESDRGYNRGVLESDRNYGLSLDDNDRQWAALDGQQSGAGDQKTVSGDVAGGILAQSLQKTVGTDPATGRPVYGTINDPATREQAFVDAWNSSGVMPGVDTVTMLSKAGYTAAEIAKYKKDYPEAFR